MTKRARQTIALAMAAAVVAIPAGCGGSEEPEGKGLPPATVSELERRLDEIERRYRAAVDDGTVGACDDIENDSIPEVNRLLESLPQDVDADIRQAVEESFGNLEELTRSECASAEPAETETEPETLPTPAETTPETTPEETTTETTPEKKPKEKPNNDDGDNGGGAPPAPVDPTSPGQGGGAVPQSGDDG